MKQATGFVLLVFCTLLIAISVSAQDDPQTRSITSDDFVKDRPAGVKPTAPGPRRPPLARRRSVTYKFVRKDQNAVRWRTDASRPRPPKPGPAAKVVTHDIGVTMWKMRRPLSSDVGVKLPVTVNKSVEWWTAERVPVTSDFQAGDKVRIGIESPTAGYLYVVNVELSSGGGYGEPRLIFPDPVAQPNFVGPGMLVDIPDQKESHPYFDINPKSANYAGELLVVIISPTRLDIKSDSKNRIIGIDTIVDFEASLNVHVFSSDDSENKVYSDAEAQATCGSRTRELERQSTATKPCGSASRELTRDEPPPQSIYRVSKYEGTPAIAFIKLNVRN